MARHRRSRPADPHRPDPDPARAGAWSRLALTSAPGHAERNPGTLDPTIVGERCLMAGSALLFIDESGADDQRLDTLAGFLRGELGTLDDVRAEPVGGDEGPDGAGVFGAAAAGAILVGLGKSGALSMVIDLARRWLKRGSAPGRSIKIEVD